MPVDRERRDRLANTIAAYMRGELDWEAFKAKCQSVINVVEESPEADPVLKRTLDCLLQFSTIYDVSEDGWDQLRRFLAFLKSDLPLPTYSSSSSLVSLKPRYQYETALARRHLFALALAKTVAFLISWWILLAAWVATWISYHICEWRFEAKHFGKFRTHNRSSLDFFPFRDEKEWLANEANCHQFKIPMYDPNTHSRRSQLSPLAKAKLTLIDWIGSILYYSALAVVVPSIIAGSVAMWPLKLILKAHNPGAGPTKKLSPNPAPSGGGLAPPKKSTAGDDFPVTLR